MARSTSSYRSALLDEPHAIEENNVYGVYDSIAEYFSNTRYSVWVFVKKFLETKSENQRGADIGCGNGKNMLWNPTLQITGYDNCMGFLDICRSKGLRVKHGDCMNLPCDDNVYDYAMAVAVYHHMASNAHRTKAVHEMIRILKPGGHGMFSVWSVENQQNEKIKREFKAGVNFVSWVRQSDNKIYERYYYVYTEPMIVVFMSQFQDKVCDVEIYNERGNWIVEFRKASF